MKFTNFAVENTFTTEYITNQAGFVLEVEKSTRVILVPLSTVTLLIGDSKCFHLHV